jgi:phosphoribosylaminoimidazolecarboxamide formyltransferase/IMP cyclohydrolase
MLRAIARALISVYDKSGLIEFARSLRDFGVEIISTGGTQKALEAAGIKALSVGEITGFPEILTGRVKTLHPRIFGGILTRRASEANSVDLAQHDIALIDLVVVNLYPFEEVSSKKGATREEIIENIDIGGVALIRAAAKNFNDVAVVVDPNDYASIINEMNELNRALSESTRLHLAMKAFRLTTDYDGGIARYFEKQSSARQADTPFPDTLHVRVDKISDLRYGENPHQRAGFYRETETTETSIATANKLHGKELSYNNIVDLDTALEVVRDFEEPVAVILKHSNPCGLARAETLAEGYRLARECDPASAFGGAVGLNRIVDRETAQEIVSTFIEAVVAPGYDASALEILRGKKNLRILETGEIAAKAPAYQLKSIVGGVLIQDRDIRTLSADNLKVVTRQQPTKEDVDSLLFAWKVVKWVKSNAVVFTSRDATIGIGAGQMSRVDSVRIAIQKSLTPLAGSYLASDAFFPFRDSIDEAAKAGVRAIIQPGGSIRDEECIRAADEHGIVMVFTGIRHFRH